MLLQSDLIGVDQPLLPDGRRVGIGEVGGIALQSLPLLDRDPPVGVLAGRAQGRSSRRLELADPRGLEEVAAEAADAQLARGDRLPPEVGRDRGVAALKRAATTSRCIRTQASY